MKNDPILNALSSLESVPLHTPEGQKQMAKALASKFNLVVAKAARIADENQWTALQDDLASAFDRLLAKGKDADKGCAALIAIARALYALDFDDPAPYRRGIRHVQIEPSYGPPIDTAAELRAVCAMGLANTRDPDKFRALVDLLVDKEWQARAGAARAIAAIGSEAASLLLRLKVLTGDSVEVMGDCFTGLLSMDLDDAVQLVSSFADAGENDVREAAILALGASRKNEAIEWLKKKFESTADSQIRKCILLSLTTSRTEAAISFVLDVIREGSEQTSAMAVSAMEVNRADSRIREMVEDAIKSRDRA